MAHTQLSTRFPNLAAACRAALQNSDRCRQTDGAELPSSLQPMASGGRQSGHHERRLRTGRGEPAQICVYTRLEMTAENGPIREEV